MKFIVLGAGPAGLATAIFLARDGHTVDIYDKATDLNQKDEESYPIGVNPRGISVLQAISEQLFKDLKAIGYVSAWSINVGKREVAHQPSGSTIGATRGRVIKHLLKVAHSTGPSSVDGVTFHLGHKLAHVDYDTKTLTFETASGQIQVDGTSHRIIACDGVWSRARRDLEVQRPGLQAEVIPWKCHFRVLLSSASPPTTLDSTVHYIFTDKGIYAAVLEGNKWAIVLRVKETDADQEILLSNEATLDNIAYLKNYIKQYCTPAVTMIPDQEYVEYFSRKTFTGAVVFPNRLTEKEWMVLLGDAAHAVLPPVGEGVNAALEDCAVLLQCSRDDPDRMFELYEKRRLPDAQALAEYAKVLLKAWDATGSDKFLQIITQILMTVALRLGIFKMSWSDKSFGLGASNFIPYSQMHNEFKRQRAIVLPVASTILLAAKVARLLVFPLLLAVTVYFVWYR